MHAVLCITPVISELLCNSNLSDEKISSGLGMLPVNFSVMKRSTVALKNIPFISDKAVVPF